MSMTMKPTYPKPRSSSTGKIGSSKPVLSRYLRNTTGSCHDRCKDGKPATTEECSTSGKTCPPTTKFTHSSHKVRTSIFKRLYNRKFVIPASAAAASVISPTDKKSPDKHLYIVPSNGSKSVVGPIKQKGGCSPWLPSCPVKNKLKFPKKDSNSTNSKAKLVPSPMVEKSRRRAEIRAAAIVSDTSLNLKENEPTNIINPRNGDDNVAKLLEEKQFKRGKVVEPRGEGSLMWRLKFRKSRFLDDRPCGSDIGRRSYKRVEAGAAQNSSKSERVVLRHCASEKGENDRSLLNNVIERTASKLAESRKSKVKALVGAFETVISLQHREPRVVFKAC